MLPAVDNGSFFHQVSLVFRVVAISLEKNSLNEAIQPEGDSFKSSRHSCAYPLGSPLAANPFLKLLNFVVPLVKQAIEK